MAGRLIEQLFRAKPGSPREVKRFLKRHVRHALPSHILSLDDDPYPPNDRLLDLALEAIRAARVLDLTGLAGRFQAGTREFLPVWPGEHYRLLAGLMSVLRPRLVIEIGTATGASCLAMKPYLPPEGRIVTYDLIPWERCEGAGMTAEDFDGRLEQRVLDLTEPEAGRGEEGLFRQAEFLFVDAAKDGVMEERLVAWFDRMAWGAPPVVMFDDIRFVEMIPVWRNIRHPKLDITSFGHWSGSGLVDWR